ncbi:microtubule-associated protein 10 [Narcine bancroftii]|uniref:microtubule-associated protein 10 n=1 Tax=Narcine bancroftii TaxID=1343680 RepID=UPI0038311BE6
MNVDANVETLFSLELLVEYVEIAIGAQPQSSPLLAVAFRLLDFPTLLVHQTKPDRAESLRRSRERGRASEGPGRPLVPFGKGKSCLFKMGLSALHCHLTNTPVYAMLLDVSRRMPKLVGSSLISMADAVENIRLDVEDRGITMPSMQGKKGLYPLYTLMGIKIGHLSAGYRLMSLGAGLLPHIPENRVLKTKIRDRELRVPGQRDSDEIANQSSGNIPSDSEICPDLVPCDPAIQHVHLNQREVPVERNPNKLAKRVHVTHKMRWQSLESELTADIKTSNVFCPPPMYYSQSKDKPKEKLAEMWKAAEYEESARLEDLESDESPELFDVHQPLSDFTLAEGRSEVTETLKMQIEKNSTNPNVARPISQLPLLNALLLELSLLHHDQLPQRIPLAVHPQLAWLYSSLKNDAPEYYQSTLQHGKSTHPDFKQQKGGVQKQRTSPRNLNKENNPKRVNTKKDREHPKRKLVYGLTNTFRLRLKQTNPDMLTLHEQKELSRKRPLKKATVKKRGEGKEKYLSKENIETLVQSSTEPDSAHSSTIPKNEKLTYKTNLEETVRHESVFRTGTKNRTVQSPEPLGWCVESCDFQTANDQDLYRKDVKIKLPEIFSHDSDHNVSEICYKAVDFFQTPNINPDLTSDPIIVEDIDAQISCSSCDEAKYSEDFTSAEPTSNSEEFTSPEPTGRLADTPGSSTEVATIRLKHKYSNNELGSSLSKCSRDNRGTPQSEIEDDSVPLLAPSKQSPIQSLKGENLVKSHHQRMILSSITPNLSDQATSSMEGSQLKRVLNPSNEQETEKQLKSVVEWGSRSVNIVRTEVSQHSSSLESSLVSSCTPPSVSDLVCSGLEMNTKDSQEDELKRTGLINECKHISELVANKLPGYTL